MCDLRYLLTTIAIVSMAMATPQCVSAQRVYFGSTPSDAQYSGSYGLDSNGRAVNVDGRSLDRYGHVIGDYGWHPGQYHAASQIGNPNYYPGGYSGLGYTNGVGYSVGLGSYSGGYVASSGVMGARVGVRTISPPRTIVVGGVYPSRAVMNNATRGGVIEYTNNGNGYIYSPGTSSQTVVSSGPSIFPTTTVVQPSQPPVIIETMPTPSASKTFQGNSRRPKTASQPADVGREINLVCPNEFTNSLTYVLNGTRYIIKPGYTQTFARDRVWTIEFLRGGSGSQVLRYELGSGTFQFAIDENGLDLKQFPAAAVDVPPAPSPPPPLETTAPIPSPDL